ncbi:3-hydroxybutyryl-CoA dehydrogenase [Roseivirga ehrenbergii]|uniref:3-hydroxybutyryl-CoA dehydrogenase n=1 Tax=Roseivirga ehrenbergii (strain DSM 102268 / JCM 13514 / KCTC 12282 / NCIMB 14502 / KMM 6017) TaxID=279360 RepID=A0A150X7T0_ROSEK|nr:3-hydroxyacyl-CoA dehydrogenase [Roseivirga ehrenbergii]KYG74750.1 3-hydroxybutyryl-CoA dehydrogenase [Roseivirga ehrenbergii]TCL13921.1 3-hydroxybutyryl-CoA dehydrogenase [Roseivirga ehrenbergii]
MQLKIEDINKVLILGAGTLGLRVGLQCAISGFETTIYDISEKALDTAIKTQASILKMLIRNEKLTEAQAEEAKGRLTFTTDPEAAADDADFLSESVTENLELKRKVWAKFGALCPEKTLFTTNTSYLLGSQIADASGRPERFCNFHFHDVFYSNVVDVMPHAGTASWINDLLMELGEKLWQTPVFVQKENTGYIFNYMLMALLGAAGSLRTLDIGSIEDIDRSWMGNFKMEMGPFGILDTVGLDTAWHITSSQPDKKSQAFAALLKSYIDAGKLGVKTGEGFYTYPNPRFKEEGFV